MEVCEKDAIPVNNHSMGMAGSEPGDDAVCMAMTAWVRSYGKGTVMRIGAVMTGAAAELGLHPQAMIFLPRLRYGCWEMEPQQP